MVDRCGPHLDRDPNAVAGPELVAVDAQPESGVAARREHRTRLLGVEGAALAEDVDPAGVAPARVEHRAADELDVLVGTAGVLGGDEMGAEEGDVLGELSGDPQRRCSDSTVSP